VLRNANSRAISHARITYDVTDRRGLEEHLRRAQKMEAIGQLAAGVAHDFNNLLMLSFAATLSCCSNRPGVEAGVARNAEAISEASDRAAGYYQQLLAFSRKQVLQARGSKCAAVVKDIANLLRRLLGPMVDFRLQLPADALWVRADESSSSSRAEPGHSMRATDAEWRHCERLSVDRGRRRFARSYGVVRECRNGLHSPARDRYGHRDGCGHASFASSSHFYHERIWQGTGLGLATVYGVVKQSEGWIWVDSTVGSARHLKFSARGE